MLPRIATRTIGLSGENAMQHVEEMHSIQERLGMPRWMTDPISIRRNREGGGTPTQWAGSSAGRLSPKFRAFPRPLQACCF